MTWLLTYLESHATRRQCSESARERRIAPYKSHQQQHLRLSSTQWGKEISGCTAGYRKNAREGGPKENWRRSVAKRLKTETITLIRDREKGGGGGGGGGVWRRGNMEEYIHFATLSLPEWFRHQGEQRWENHFHYWFSVSLIVRDKVTRQCPQTTTFLKRKEAEAESSRGPSADQPNGLPLMGWEIRARDQVVSQSRLRCTQSHTRQLLLLPCPPFLPSLSYLFTSSVHGRKMDSYLSVFQVPVRHHWPVAETDSTWGRREGWQRTLAVPWQNCSPVRHQPQCVFSVCTVMCTTSGRRLKYSRTCSCQVCPSKTRVWSRRHRFAAAKLHVALQRQFYFSRAGSATPGKQPV